MELTRTQLFNLFSRLKRMSRSLKLLQHEERESIRRMRRAKRMLEMSGNPFNAHRVEVLSGLIESGIDLRQQINRAIADLGPILVQLCDQADELLSDHDKAQVLSISHVRLQSLLEDGDQHGLFALIFVHHAEHHRDGDFLDPEPSEMPLWEIAYQSTMQTLLQNQELRQVTREKFSEWLAENGVATYRRVVEIDGSERFERIPPKLKIVK